MDDECLEYLAEQFHDRYHSEPARYRDSACTMCPCPLLTPVVVVARETWDTLLHAATFDELGHDLC
jgi:hypothetical protein